MADQRKPIAFDTTIRNPYRIPDFIRVYKEYEGQLLTHDIIYEIEAKLIQQKYYEPTRATLGKYQREFNGQFHFEAQDQSPDAETKVSQYYNEWKNNEAGVTDINKIIYLLNNTTTDHRDYWDGGWETRLWTQCKFLNELGLVYMEKGKAIKISETANLMLCNNDDDEDCPAKIQSAFLCAFARYQTNNPYRNNTINVNFFPLVLNVIKYLKDTYNRPGIFYQDITFIIAWDNNDYVQLAEYIQKFRDVFGYNNVSNETVYNYAMNLLDAETPNNIINEARDEFIKKKRKHYKFEQLTKETRDEVIRKLRMTRLISFRGAGRFIDLNSFEIDKINYIINTFSNNVSTFDEDKDKYFDYMSSIDYNLLFIDDVETEEVEKTKINAIAEYSNIYNWNFIKDEMNNIIHKHASRDNILQYIGEDVRLEFLCSIVIKKKMPHIVVKANYIADDEGIPISHATGQRGKKTGADIDVFDNQTHAIVEPTISWARNIQVEHEVPAIKNHVIATKRYDEDNGMPYNEWFAIFIAPSLVRDAADEVKARELINKVHIYGWNIDDFVDFTIDNNISSINDYKLVRDYMIPQEL